MARAVQIREAITQRKEFVNWEKLKVVEWQTQQLAGMMASLAPSQEGQEALLKHASQISLTEGNKVDTQSGNQKAPKMYTLKDGTQIPASEMSNYSYEDFDHGDLEKKAAEAARRKNAGVDIMGMF